MVDREKIEFDVSSHPNIAQALVEVFDSQIIGGKRYDLATAGRRLANATYATSHKVDISQAINYAMDLTPLIQDDSMDVKAYILAYIDRFKKDDDNFKIIVKIANDFSSSGAFFLDNNFLKMKKSTVI